MELCSADRDSSLGSSDRTSMPVIALYLMSSSRSLRSHANDLDSTPESLLLVMTSLSKFARSPISSGSVSIELKLTSISCKLSNSHRNTGKFSMKLEEMLRALSTLNAPK